MDTNEKKRPAHEVRIGTVKATIWSNSTRQGVRFGVTVGRIYKDGEKWKTTGTFDRDDLLTLRKVLDEAHTWIHSQVKRATEPQPHEYELPA